MSKKSFTQQMITPILRKALRIAIVLLSAYAASTLAQPIGGTQPIAVAQPISIAQGIVDAESLSVDASSKKTQTATLVVRVPPLEKSSQAHLIYFIQLLELALQKTQATDGPFVVQQYPELYTINRFISELERDKGVINVMWTMADQNRNQKLLPIKISLLKGLNSYRIFLIRAEDQEKFHQIKNLDNLRQLVGGQGSHWPDTEVMRRNNLPLVTSAHYELLFSMLAGKRFDYFPRGLYEIWSEQEANADKHLKIEDSLMLHYPAPIYFYVNKNNPALADRIQRGLTIAIDDGSFDKLFFSVPGFKRGYDELKKNNRIKFDLNTDFDLED